MGYKTQPYYYLLPGFTGIIYLLVFVMLIGWPGLVLAEAKDSTADQLVYWSYKGNLKKVQNLLKSGANSNTFDNRERGALHEASRQQQVAIVQFLIENGANPNSIDKSGETPLFLSVWYSDCAHLETFKLLLKKGARFQEGQFADFSNIRACNPYEILEVSFENGANVNDLDRSKIRATALMNRIKEVDIKSVELIMKYKPNLSIKDVKGKTVQDYIEWIRQDHSNDIVIEQIDALINGRP